MAYNNPALFDAIFSGASGGSFGRWITAEHAAEYDSPVDAVQAFATAVDAAIPTIAVISLSDVALLQSIVQGVITDRSLLETNTAEANSDYADISSAIAALFEEGRARLNSAALTTDQVDNASAVPGATASDALDNLLGRFTALNTDQVLNVSDVPGTSASDSLDYLYRKLRIITETTAARTISASDVGALIRCTNAGGCVLTLNNNVLAAEDFFMVRQVGAAAVSFAGTVAITPPVTNVNTTGQQGATIGIVMLTATTAESMGDLSDA